MCEHTTQLQPHTRPLSTSHWQLPRHLRSRTATRPSHLQKTSLEMHTRIPNLNDCEFSQRFGVLLLLSSGSVQCSALTMDLGFWCYSLRNYSHTGRALSKEDSRCIQGMFAYGIVVVLVLKVALEKESRCKLSSCPPSKNVAHFAPYVTIRIHNVRCARAPAVCVWHILPMHIVQSSLYKSQNLS